MRTVRHSLPDLPDLPRSASFPGGSISLAGAVSAILAGTSGFAFDPTDTATLFQDTAGATPVTAAADPVGRINGKWGASLPNWQQNTAARRPAWDGTGLAMDGVDDQFATFSDLARFNAKPAIFWSARVNVTSLAATRYIVGISGASAGNLRFQIEVLTTGLIRAQTRRLDADAGTTISSAAGVIVAGNSYVVTVESDFAGTGNCRIWVNGTLVASGAIAGALGNCDATNSNRIWQGRDVNGGAYMAGWWRRQVFAPYAMNDANRAAIEAWVAAA